jgi:hypothetical protein
VGGTALRGVWDINRREQLEAEGGAA